MTQSAPQISFEVKESDAPLPLPLSFSELRELVQLLQESGVKDEIFKRLILNRKSGSYIGFDLVLMLLSFFVTGAEHRGLNSFCRVPFASEIAAMGKRARFPSQAAASRMFESMDREQVMCFSQWLLTESFVDLFQPLWMHESALSRDALGQSWHLFF